MENVSSSFDLLPVSDSLQKKKIFRRRLVSTVRSLVLSFAYGRKIKETKLFFSNYPFSKINDVFPEIEKKALSRYFSTCVNVVGRFDAILDHYRLFLHYFADAIFVRSHTDEILIYENTYKGQNLQLYLCRQDGFARESELRVKLVFDNVTIVQMGMSFVDMGTLGFSQSRPALWIGIVKSSIPGEAGRESFRQFTKAFEGLRPKYVHVIFVQSLAKALGITEIFAPSYIGQAVATARRFKPRVHADYDGFWEECGATKINRHLYQLPCDRKPRDISEYKPNKRAQAKKRQELEIGLRDSIFQTFVDMKNYSEARLTEDDNAANFPLSSSVL